MKSQHPICANLFQMLTMIIQRVSVSVTPVSQLLDINVSAKEFHLKTSVIDVLTDQTRNIPSAFVNVTVDTLCMERNVFQTETMEQMFQLIALQEHSLTRNKENA